jgi:hypothetical protein
MADDQKGQLQDDPRDRRTLNELSVEHANSGNRLGAALPADLS